VSVGTDRHAVFWDVQRGRLAVAGFDEKFNGRRAFEGGCSQCLGCVCSSGERAAIADGVSAKHGRNRMQPGKPLNKAQ